jgi:hypothetical protein
MALSFDENSEGVKKRKKADLNWRNRGKRRRFWKIVRLCS